MSKCVLLSVRPQWCELIANGKKTIEVRKTRPKLETPFKCYIYCTIGGDALCPPHMNSPKWDIHRQGNGTAKGRKMTARERDKSDYRFANGKVIGEFVCDSYIRWSVNPLDGLYMIFPHELTAACLIGKEFEQYGNGKALYGWHISALQIYDKPRELNEFYFPPEKYCEKELCGGCPHDQMPDVNGEYAYDCEWRRPITRAPQSWCYVEEYDGKR